MKKTILAMAAMTLMTGCAIPQQTIIPDTSKLAVSNKYFDVKITPASVSGWQGVSDSFDLTIINKTNKEIMIDWNKTMYVSNGITNGTFGFEGIKFADCGATKSNDIVFAGSIFRKIIS